MAEPETNRGLKPEEAEEGRIPKRTNHLLVIGIDDYQHVGKLANARRDAEALVKVLTEKYQFEAQNVKELYDTDASKRAVTRILRRFAEKATPEDNLLIYFSGHGHYDDFLKEGYWIPCDAEYEAATDYITYTYLRQIIKATQAHHAFIIADSCYSGAALVRKKDFKAERFERNPSRWLLASGRNEVVPDGIAGEHSPFADGLLDLLTRYADTGIKAGTLVDKLTLNVTYNSDQTPIGRALYGVGDRGGEFVFYPRKAKIGLMPRQDPFEIAQEINTGESWLAFIQQNPKHPRFLEAIRIHASFLSGNNPVAEPIKPIAKKEIPNILRVSKDNPWIPTLIKVEGGTFMMGKEKDKKGEKTKVETFYMGKTPVTVAQYLKYCEMSGKQFPDEKPDWGWLPSHPMVYVSWYDVKEYCKWLSLETGETWRLPIEVEWEFAARGGNKSKGFEYAGSDDIDEVAWYWINSGDKRLYGEWGQDKIKANNCRTHPVAQLKANELGFYDMSGNVSEWCEDKYEGYSSYLLYRIGRGGSWYNNFISSRVSSGLSWFPSDHERTLGFRIARNP